MEGMFSSLAGPNSAAGTALHLGSHSRSYVGFLFRSFSLLESFRCRGKELLLAAHSS